MKAWLIAGCAALALAGSAQAQKVPDLEGNWTNATMTPQARPAQYGDRLVMTAEEARKIETDMAAQVERGNQRTDPNAPTVTDGTVGGYNRGFLDPGARVMRVNGQPRTSLITTPDGQAPPPRAGSKVSAAQMRALTVAAPYLIDEYGSAALAGEPAQSAQRFDNPEEMSLADRCLTSFGRNAPPPMFPNGFYNNNYRIVQGTDAVAILVEMVHDARVVRLNARHRTDGLRPWFGDSIGWYEGDALVVETTNIPKAQNLFGSWETLKVTERFRRAGKDRLHYQFSVEDPSIWDKPWGGEYEFAALEGQVYEYACHEGNYAMPGILGGSRAADRADMQAKASKGGGAN